MKVVVVGSGGREHALAVALARHNGARITFLHVRADFGRTGEGALLATMDPSGFARANAGPSNGWLARAAAAAQAGMDVARAASASASAA